MNYYLDEMESVKTLGKIRINMGAEMKSSKNELDSKLEISSSIKIVKLNELWENVHFELTLDNESTISSIDGNSKFSVYLTNSQNSDKLIIADNDTQERDNSNIFDIVYYMWNHVWVPVAKSELEVSLYEWEELVPDIFKLIPEQDFKEMDYQKLEKKFEYVTMDRELSKLLHAEFFMGEQPIFIYASEFYDFCKDYEVF